MDLGMLIPIRWIFISTEASRSVLFNLRIRIQIQIPKLYEDIFLDNFWGSKDLAKRIKIKIIVFVYLKEIKTDKQTDMSHIEELRSLKCTKLLLL